MRRHLTLAVCGVLLGCSAETGASLEITGVPAPSTSCTLSASTTDFLSRGILDPRGYGFYVPLGFNLPVLLQNNGITPDTDPATIEGGRNVRNRGNDVHVSGFDVCWDRAAKHGEYGASRIDCESMPTSQRAFISTSVNVLAGGGKSVTSVTVLQPQHLQAKGIYGPSFNPTAIPSITPQFPVATPTVGGKTVPFTYPAESASFAGRAPAWGGVTDPVNDPGFPHVANNTDRVIVAVRASGTTAGGSGVTSNWLTFPVDVSVGYLSAFCTPFPDATGCTANNYFGGFIDLGASCLPGAGGSVTCTTTTACP